MGIKKYLKLFFAYSRQYLIYSLTYRVSFVVELLVETGYNLSFVLFYVVIYQNTKTIGGWDYNQMLFFMGLTIISSELMVAYIFGDKLWHLPENIKNGVVDFWLLKPIHPLFSALMPPYTTPLFTSLPGFYLVLSSYSQITPPPDIIQILVAMIVFCLGMFTLMCAGTAVTLLSFKFVNASTLPRIVSRAVFEYKSYPHTIYKGFLKVVFFVLFPVVYVSSVPTDALFHQVDWILALAALVLAIVFLFILKVTWDKMIRLYSSASS